MIDRKAAQKVVDDVLAEAKKLTGAETQVSLTAVRAANTRFARSEVTSTGDSDDTTVNISVSWGQRHADAATNQLDPASVRGALRRAAQLARLAPEDPEHMPVLGPQSYL